MGLLLFALFRTRQGLQVMVCVAISCVLVFFVKDDVHGIWYSVSMLLFIICGLVIWFTCIETNWGQVVRDKKLGIHLKRKYKEQP